MNFKDIINKIDSKEKLFLSGLYGVSFAFFIYKIYDQTNFNLAVILENQKQAELFYSDLSFFLKEQDIIFYPELNFQPYEEITHKKIIHERLENYYKIFSKKRFIFITSIKNILLKKNSKETLFQNIIKIKQNDIIDFAVLEKSLLETGYERAGKVLQKGEYSIRGDIIDIFPVNCPKPVRLEFFDDMVEDIRIFNIEDQKSIQKIKNIDIYPAEEIILNRKQIEYFNKQVDSLIGKMDNYKPDNLWEKPVFNRKSFRDLKERINNVEFFSDIYKYSPLLYKKIDSILENFNKDILLFSPSNISFSQSYKAVFEEFVEFYRKRVSQNLYVPEPEQFIFSLKNIEKIVDKYRTVFYSIMPFNVEEEIQFHVKGIPDFSGDVQRFFRFYEDRFNKKYRINFLSEYKEYLCNLKDIINKEKKKEIDFKFSQGVLSQGFEIDIFNEIFIHDFEFFGRIRRDYSGKYKSKILTQEIESIYDLEEGDYVVHVENGIGRYLGIKKIESDGKIRDFFTIEYADNMNLLLSLEKINLIHKYIGDEDNPPPLNRLGSKEFKRAKSKVERSLIDITKDLIKIYAIRNKINGLKFSKDNEWQKEFESSFKYIETPDQIRSLKEIKEEMESNKPMDRLLCGDVGYGKTEVAIRIAFKATMEGKQVAVLVPTTILAQQHYNTFQERIQDYPIRIEMLSRFLSKREQKKVIRDTNEGKVDILIGTHRLISPDIKFKDLGLVIIDEEQRFGVMHKEKLKMLRSIVDVITMSATPIPRTLYMCLSGIRDISLLETPPEGRIPVETKVEKFSPDIIRKSILFELDRGGQIFFVHNRIKTIYAMQDYLKRIVPEAKFLVAHGRMESDELELAMLEFIDKNYDVLLCTTIIESGIDMPNVNTIIINRADTFGLSQLYQLRGRVGRGLHKGYAFLLYPGNKAITEKAQKRLLTIYEYSELGSGYKIAMRDMEIRGAGNIFGPQQHGNIVAVGLELYSKILQIAIKRMKGEEIDEECEPDMDFEYNAYIPDSFTHDNKIKIEIYKDLNKCWDFEQLQAFIDELKDRFGKNIPIEMQDLFLIQEIKIACRKIGILTIKKYETKIYEFVFQLDFKEITKKIAEKARNVFKTDRIKKNNIYINIEKDNFINKLKKKLLLLL